MSDIVQTYYSSNAIVEIVASETER